MWNNIKPDRNNHATSSDLFCHVIYLDTWRDAGRARCLRPLADTWPGRGEHSARPSRSIRPPRSSPSRGSTTTTATNFRRTRRTPMASISSGAGGQSASAARTRNLRTFRRRRLASMAPAEDTPWRSERPVTVWRMAMMAPATGWRWKVDWRAVETRLVTTRTGYRHGKQDGMSPTPFRYIQPEFKTSRKFLSERIVPKIVYCAVRCIISEINFEEIYFENCLETWTRSSLRKKLSNLTHALFAEFGIRFQNVFCGVLTYVKQKAFGNKLS